MLQTQSKRVKLDFNEELEHQTIRYATEPLRRMTSMSRASMPRAKSVTAKQECLDEDDAGRSNLTQVRIQGSQEGTVGIYLGDGVLYTADLEALRTASSFFHDKLQYTQQDLGCHPGFENIVAIFALPVEGKPILARVSKQDLTELVNTSKKGESSAQPESRVLSESVTVKSELASPAPSTTSKTNQNKFASTSRSKDAHLALLHMMHMQDMPKFHSPLAYVLEVAKHIVDLSQPRIYDCMDVVRPRLGPTLLTHGRELFLAIKDDPPRMAMLACALEDGIIFKEALIHLVGCHPSWPDHWTRQSRLEKRQECAGVLVNVQRKAGELKRRRELLDRDLLLNTITTDDAQEIDIARSPETWLVAQMYRDAFASLINAIQIEDEDGHQTPDPLQIGAVYRRLLRGGNEFLPLKEVYRKFEQLRVGYDHNVVLDDVMLLKGYASEKVREICRNGLLSNLEGADVDVGHLTCVEVGEHDMPWVVGRRALGAVMVVEETMGGSSG